MLQSTRYIIALIGLIVMLALSPGASMAQTKMSSPVQNGVYCGGIVTPEHVSNDTYVISGPQSDAKLIYAQGEKVFINKGEKQGVKVGDEFLASRAETDPLPYRWFQGQAELARAMGTYYADLGRLRVVHVQANTSVAEVVLSCDFIQRGDILQKFSERPQPAFKAADVVLDPFAAPTGKGNAMVVLTHNFGEVSAAGGIVYVNLGSAQGVKVGDYFRIYRYQDQQDHSEAVFQNPHTGYMVQGFGSTPVAYSSKEIPRDIIGEGVVSRVGPDAATVVVTTTVRGVYVGDYVELE